ncbi:MAG: hypothetical protein GF372_14125 [Candidatus Marinimicrobia bacterium]|nr:hypothetical protein [Candidatus Neomarinimicrobiota bacterium]
MAAPTFRDDLKFLQRYGDIQTLSNPQGGVVALSAAYQGRVMTSAFSRRSASLGWVNRSFIQTDETGTQFDNYGGEDRFWLGPEGGQFSLYFPQASDFLFSNWQVPEVLHTGEWEILSQSPDSVTFTREVEITNYSGTTFSLQINRTVRLVDAAGFKSSFQSALPTEVDYVGYETENRVTNTGNEPWVAESGLLSIWILGMYNPFDKAYVVIPFQTDATGPIVNDDYFGEVPESRLSIRDGYLIFLCDGEYRSKIGLGPDRATPTLGSYIPSKKLLTLIHYNKPEQRDRYVNSMWEIQEEPYDGDVVNSYNDGPPEPGIPPLGGFYELETSSPALALSPGESYTHVHQTVHLSGDENQLNPLAENVLGVSVTTIAQGIE